MLLPINPEMAHAIMNGKSALGNPYVVRLSINGNYGCSGVLVNPNIVVTAGHCVMTNNILVEPTAIRVYKPGVNIRQANPVTNAIAINVPSEYEDPETTTSPNDIAFLLLAKPFVGAVTLPIADPDTTTEILDSGDAVQIYGYGKINPSTSSDSPFYYDAFSIPQKRLRGYAGYEHTYFNLTSDENGATCPGDSGGPVIGTLNGIMYLIGIHSGGKGPCNDTGTGTWGTTETIAGEYTYLLDELMETYENLKPSPVTNLRLLIQGATGTLTWNAPSDSPRKITSYTVMDSDLVVLCDSLNLSCKFSFSKIGKNTYQVIAKSDEFESEATLIEANIINASNPELLGVYTLQSKVQVKWNAFLNSGNAQLVSIVIVIKDGKNGPVLCEANLQESGCYFNLEQASYNLYLELKSNLGKNDSVFLQRYSGILESSIVNRVLSNYTKIKANLFSLKSKNPGYAKEIDALTLEIPEIDENFVFSNETWEKSLDLQNQINVLTMKIISKPRKITLKCYKGSIVKNVVGVNPKCPAGYKIK